MVFQLDVWECSLSVTKIKVFLSASKACEWSRSLQSSWVNFSR